VIDADGRPLKDAEIRFEQKGRRVSPIVSRTDIGGHYTALLPRGVYKMSLTARGTIRAAVTVKATGEDSRIDFDLRPSAEKQIKHYVWVGGDTGSHLPGRWLKPAFEKPCRLLLRRRSEVGAVSQRLIPTGEQSGLQTRMA
jgi:hypothetical protein